MGLRSNLSSLGPPVEANSMLLLVGGNFDGDWDKNSKNKVSRIDSFMWHCVKILSTLGETLSPRGTRPCMLRKD